MSDVAVGDQQARLTEPERLAWLRLIRSETIGPATFKELIAHCGSAAAAIEAAPELSARAGRTIRICPLEDAEAELDDHRRCDARLVAECEADYPPLLAHIEGAPPLLSVRGDSAIFSRSAVAIVGSRNASLSGTKLAKQIARGLGDHGYVIASGLARGIDAAAHEAALPTGTIAVLAGGLNRIYPPDNIELAEMILAEGGAHVSEMPIGWEPRARDFPRRNRLISGVALGAVIVEAASRSGSLITARLAAEQGRLVFAVPGSPLDPRAAGANRLIHDGARIVTSVDDIVSEIEPMVEREAAVARQIDDVSVEEATTPADADDRDRRRVVEALGPAPVEIDELVRFTGLAPAVIHLVLLELDLAGRIARHRGGKISLILGRSP